VRTKDQHLIQNVVFHFFPSLEAGTQRARIAFFFVIDFRSKFIISSLNNIVKTSWISDPFFFLQWISDLYKTKQNWTNPIQQEHRKQNKRAKQSPDQILKTENNKTRAGKTKLWPNSQNREQNQSWKNTHVELM